MTELATPNSNVATPSVERIVAVTEVAVQRLISTFLALRTELDDQKPAELRAVVPLRVNDALLRIEVTVLSVIEVGDDIGADIALRVIETGLNYDVTKADRSRLLVAFRRAFYGVGIIYPKGHDEDTLCLRLSPRDLHI